MENFWTFPPIQGEMSGLSVVFMFEPSNKNSQLGYYVSGTKNIIKVDISEVGMTSISVRFAKTGFNRIFWVDELKEISYNNVYLYNCKNFLFVSCDMFEAESKHSLWEKMKDEIQQTRTTLVHLGDQAYMDKVYKKNVKKSRRNKITDAEIIENFGERYYQTWLPHVDVLQKVSNYYLWDDHEVCNDILLSEKHSDKDHQRVRNLAVEAYEIYQDNFQYLRTNSITDYCWAKRFGENTIMIAIERTSRVISNLEILEEIYREYNLDPFTHLILVMAGPPIPAPVGNYGRLYKSLTGNKKFYTNEWLTELYNGLFDWMDKDSSNRVIMIGGDLHYGTMGQLNRNNKTIPVIISSPITNQPTYDRYIASKGMAKNLFLTENLEYNTIISKARRCYAKVTIENGEFVPEMVYSTDSLPKSTMKYLGALITFANAPNC